MVQRPRGVLRFSGCLQDPYSFNNNSGMLFSSSLSLCHEHPVAFSRGHMPCDDIITLRDKVLYACGYWALRDYSVLIANIVNTDRYNPHKQKHFGFLQF